MKGLYFYLVIYCFGFISVVTGQEISWAEKKPLPISVRNGSAAACNGKIYFMGGYCNETPERFEINNFEYTPETDSWNKKAPLPTGRSNFTLVTAENKVYAIGGDPFSDKNEIYDPQTDSWTTLAPMPTPRQHLYGTVLDGKIYMIGGLQPKEGSASPRDWSYENISVKNEVYDIASDTWQELAPMPTPRHDTRAIAFDGNIYVIGGMGEKNNMWKALSVVEMYDPQTNSWKRKTNLPEPRDGFGISAIMNKIYVVGGFNDDGVVKTVLVYDPNLDVWNTTTDFPNNNNGSAGVATIDNQLYVVGGCDKAYNSYNNTFIGKVNNWVSIDYLGQTPPGDEPVIFARGIISDNYQQHGVPAFSPDGNEVFWQTNKLDSSNNWLISVMTMRLVGNKWTTPDISPHSSGPVFSPDGNRLYVGSKGEGADPYFVKKQSDGWSAPESLGLVTRFPELKFAYNLSITKNGTLYFLGYAPADSGLWNNYAIYRTELINGEYAKPELLPPSINASGGILNWTPFIAPDESYLLFCSRRVTPKDDYGDLYVCFRKPDGSWTDRISLGEPINSNGQERFPSVSPDGKYLFFTRWTPDYDEDVFWVSAQIIGTLKAKSIQKQLLEK